MSVQEIRSFVESCCEADEPFAVALLTETWASAPRRPGARFAATAGGRIAGNVSAGCVEADLALRLERLLAGGPAGFVDYGVTDETAMGVGLSCGGRMRLFLRRGACQDPLREVLLQRVDSGQQSVLVTALDADRDRRWLLDGTMAVVGSTVEQPVLDEALEAARTALDTGASRVVEADSGALFVEAVLPDRRLVIVGGTPVGVQLARLAAAVEIPVVVIEPREAYATAVADSGAELKREWPKEAMPAIRLDSSCAVAVVAHDGKLDVPALEAGLAAGCVYVGLLGGRRTRESRLEELAELGFDQSRLDRIRAPIGIEIGAETPREIAISILAQVVAAWRGA
jgi:xanthine dehydrogenase accessory factor